MKTLGTRGEDLVAAHYQKLGYKVLARNFIFPYGKQRGELDLIVCKNRELVFIEVKARRNAKFGSPFESVDTYKQRKLVTTVKLYLRLNHKYETYDFRIDVAAVDIDNKLTPVIILANAIEDSD
jgi:putative endonuclease